MNPIESTKTPAVRSHLSKVGAMMLLSFAAACGPSIVETHGVNLAAPAVLSNTPLNGAADTAIDTSISVTFDQEMDADTVSDATFTVTSDDPAANGLGHH